MSRSFWKLYKDVVATPGLLPVDWVLYAVLAEYTRKTGTAYPGIRRLTKNLCSRSINRTQESLKRLEKVGMIVIERQGERKRNHYRLAESVSKSGTDTSNQDKTKLYPNQVQAVPKTGTDLYLKQVRIEKRTIKEKTTTSLSTSQKTKKAVQSKKVFIEPTLQLLKAEIERKGYIVDPNVFFEWYDCRGWKIKGGGLMKSWQATLSRWNAKDVRDQKEGRNHGTTTKTRVDRRNYQPQPAETGTAVIKLA